MKKNISLTIDGIAPEKVIYDTDNHSLVVLYPEQKEFKKGDKVRLNKDLNLKLGKWYNGLVYIKEIDNVKDAILTIDRVSESNGNIKAYNNIDGGWWWYRPEWLEHIVEDEVKFKKGDIVFENNRIIIVKNMPSDYYVLYYQLRNQIYGNGSYGIPFSASTVRLATPEEQQTLFDALKKEGKKWNAETLQVEDLDISEIAVDLESACEYLKKPIPNFSSLFCSLPYEDYCKYSTQITLQLIREAWNKFDGFEVDNANSEQGKYFPVLDVCGDINFIASWGTTHISALSFPIRERALQFGNQFKDLLKTAMGLSTTHG